MNLSPRNRFFAVAAGAVLSVVVLAFVLVFPQFGKLGNLDAQIASATEQQKAADTLLKQRQDIKNQAAATDARMLQLQNSVPENPEMPSLIIALQDEANAAGVRLAQVEMDDPTAGASFVTLPLTAQVLGTWSDTIEFMQQLRKLERQVRIVGFETNLASDTDLENVDLSMPPLYQVQTLLTLEAYMVPAVSAPTSAPPAPTAPTTP